MYTRTRARLASEVPSPGKPCRLTFSSPIRAAMLSNVSWVWATASPACRVCEWVMLAVPETKIVA